MGVENDMPEGWVENTLGNTCELLDCLHRTPKYSNHGYPMVRVTDVKNGPLDTSECLKVDYSTFNDFSKNYKPKIGDIVFTRVGSFGLSAIVKKEEPFCIGQNTTLILAKKIDPFFLFYYLISKVGRHQIVALSSGSTQPTISMASIRMIRFHLPPLPEQKAIAKVLTAFDDKIELLQAQNKTLETMAQTIFKEWFGKYQIGDELPEGWRVGKLDEVLSICGGSTPSTKNPDFWDGKINWTSPKDLSNSKGIFLLNTEKKITKEGLNKISSGLLPKGTLLLSSRAPVGYLSITNLEVAINQGYIAILPEQYLSNKYMYLWLDKYMQVVKNAANGSTFLEISKTAFRNIECVIPLKNTLERFDQITEPIFGKILRNTLQIQSLAKTRDTLLPKLMRGQVRVKNIKHTADA